MTDSGGRDWRVRIQVAHENMVFEEVDDAPSSLFASHLVLLGIAEELVCRRFDN